MGDISIHTEGLKIDQSATFVGAKCEFRRLVIGYDGILTDLFVGGRVGTELEKHTQETVRRIKWVQDKTFGTNGIPSASSLSSMTNWVAAS